MGDKLDMSLDDIIKQNKGPRGGGGGRRGRGSFRGGRRRDQARNDEEGSSRNDVNGVFRGGVNKNNRRRGGFQQIREIPDVWQHDLYDDTQGPPRRDNRGPSSSAAGSGKLVVSNLDFGVSDSDIKELFLEFGSLIKATVHYDRSGRSLGTADVIYHKKTDAVKAMRKYNNVPLDGRPMNIQLEGSSPNRSLNSRLGQRTESSRPPTRRGSFRGGNRGGNRGGRRQDKKLPTLEDLDAQLDAYNAKMDVE